MSNGGGLYGGLEPLPDIDAVLRGVATGSGQGDEKAPPKPGAWNYSPIVLDDWFQPAGSAESTWGTPSPYSSAAFDEEEYRRLLSRRGLIDTPPTPTDPLGPLPELNLPGTKTTAPKESTCNTCAQALAAAASLGTEAAIRCLWTAASRTFDNRGRPLTHGLYPGDSDRAGLLRKLRERCAPVADEEPPDDRRTTSLPPKPKPEPSAPAFSNDLLPGPHTKLGFPPTRKTCGRKKPSDRFEIQQAEREPWESGTFPCPPDRDRLEKDRAASRWWYALPSWEDRGAADTQVRDLQEALEDCVESVRKRALEQVTPFETMAEARTGLDDAIEELKRDAVAWGTASLRNMRTLALYRLLNWSLFGPLGSFGPLHLVTLPADLIVSEYDQRPDRPGPRGGSPAVFKTIPTDHAEATREANEFVAGQEEYDEALRELSLTRDSLVSALKCEELYRTADRRTIAAGSAALLERVLDGRYTDLKQRIRGAESRLELGEAACELGYRLCCALLRCQQLEAGLRAIEAVEKFRNYTIIAQNNYVGFFTAGVIRVDCDRVRRDPGYEDDADALVAFALGHGMDAAERDCRLVDG